MLYLSRKTLLVALALILSASAYFFISHTAVVARHAVCDMIDKIDLGERERGETIISELEITNRGMGTLVIDDQRSSCSCTVLLVKQGSDYLREESLIVPPMSTRKTYARLTVNAPAGQGMRTIIDVRTNEPGHPRKQIEILVPHIKGGAYTQPESVAFGTVQRGAIVTRHVEVRDSANNTRKVIFVDSSNPRRVTARLIPSKSSDMLYSEDKRHDKLIGTIEVIIDTSTAWSVDEKLLLQYDSASFNSNTIEIHGVVQENLYSRPSFVILPRSSTAGLLYELSISIVSLNDVPFKIIGMKCPAGVTATERESNSTSSQARKLEIKLQPSGESRHEDLSLIVECIRDGSPEVISVVVPLRLRERVSK